MRAHALFLILCILLASCQRNATPPALEGPSMGDIPLLGEPSPLPGDELPLSLQAATQAHGETMETREVGHFYLEVPFLDTVEMYDSEMKRLGWQFIDSLQFGNGGNLRRYHRGEQRAVLAFEPDGDGTRFMLMQGVVR